MMQAYTTKTKYLDTFQINLFHCASKPYKYTVIAIYK